MSRTTLKQLQGQALNYIINLYTDIGNNEPLIENARHKLLGLDKEDD